MNSAPTESPGARWLGGRVEVQVGDITRSVVDVIVNAANSSLLGGGGVDGAIHRAGGPEILEECRALRRDAYPDGLPTGEVAATTAGRLPARRVFHTVGPVYGRHGGREPELLRSCYEKSLRLAEEAGLHTIAFPAVSTGVYGYPREEAARVVSTCLADVVPTLHSMQTVYLVFFSQADARVFVEHTSLPA